MSWNPKFEKAYFLSLNYTLPDEYVFLFSSSLLFSRLFLFPSLSLFDKLLLDLSYSFASTYLQATTVSAPSHVFHAIQFYYYFKLAEYIVLLIINHFNPYIK